MPEPIGIESMTPAQLVEYIHAQDRRIAELRDNGRASNEAFTDLCDSAATDAREAAATIAALTARVRHLTQALASTTAALTSYL